MKEQETTLQFGKTLRGDKVMKRLTSDCLFSPTEPRPPEAAADPGTTFASHNSWPEMGAPCRESQPCDSAAAVVGKKNPLQSKSNADFKFKTSICS